MIKQIREAHSLDGAHKLGGEPLAQVPDDVRGDRDLDDNRLEAFLCRDDKRKQKLVTTSSTKDRERRNSVPVAAISRSSSFPAERWLQSLLTTSSRLLSPIVPTSRGRLTRQERSARIPGEYKKEEEIDLEGRLTTSPRGSEPRCCCPRGA